MKNLSKSKLFLKRNSSTILSCLASIGVISTVVLAIKNTPKAVYLLKDAEEEKKEKLTTMETVKIVAPIYISTILIGTSTIACIFGANILNKKAQASLISAYGLLDRVYKDYKKKVEEIHGEESTTEIKTKIAEDKLKEKTIIKSSDNLITFYDYYSDRYFESTMEKVIEAEYNLNRDLHTHDTVTLNDFYVELGIEPTKEGDDFGWVIDINYDKYWQTWIDFSHEEVDVGDGLKVWFINIINEPYGEEVIKQTYGISFREGL